jgi:hypothetical protein
MSRALPSAKMCSKSQKKLIIKIISMISRGYLLDIMGAKKENRGQMVQEK